MYPYLFIIILLLISLSIYSKQFGKRKIYLIVKPLTMLCIITLPLLEIREVYSPYSYLIITGLIFSLLGDLFLLYPEKYFNNGLYSFLIAHILYVFAFNQNVDEYSYKVLFIVLIFTIVAIKYLALKLGIMKYPVILYILVITAMLFSAVNSDMQLGTITYISIGAILFTISDTVLAFNKFYKKFKFAEPIILSTYFIAQLLFATTI